MDALLATYDSDETDDEQAAKEGVQDGARGTLNSCPPSARGIIISEHAAKSIGCSGTEQGKRPHSTAFAPSPVADRGKETRPRLPDPAALLSADSAEAAVAQLVQSSSAGDPHQGRVRRYPHLEGWFPTIVLIKVDLPAAVRHALSQLVDQLKVHVPGLEPVAACTRACSAPPRVHHSHTAGAAGLTQLPLWPSRPQPLSRTHTMAKAQAQMPVQVQVQEGQGAAEVAHISLSRSVPVEYAQIRSLTQRLAQQLASRPGAAPFRMYLQGLRVFVNDECTRTFVSVMAQEYATQQAASTSSAASETHTRTPQSLCQSQQQQQGASGLAPSSGSAPQLCALVRCVDTVFEEFELAPFHKVPLPHISIAWVLGDQRAVLQAAIQASMDAVAFSHTFEVCSATCIVGQRHYTVWEHAQ